MMYRSIVGALVTIGLLGAAACSDTLGPEDIAGTWEATSMLFISSNNPAVSEDMITLGAEFSIAFTKDGTLSSTFTYEGSTEIEGGTYTMSGSDITLTIGGELMTGRITKSDGELRVNFPTGLEYDFDGDEVDDPAALLLVLIRA